MPSCIWCLTENATPSLEHIIPEALGCPEGFVLTDGVVCKSCNNGLAHLDQAVIADFDMAAFFANVPRKGGRSPVIRGRGNLVATRGDNGPELSVNMEKYSVPAHDGTRLGAFGRSTRNIEATLTHQGQEATTSFSVSVGQDPKFVRGITKIALSSLAYFLGPEAALAERFNAVRSFVRDGIGQRQVLMLLCADTEYRNEASAPFQSEDGEYGIGFRIAHAEFLVDLSPALSINAILARNITQSYGPNEYVWLPADRPKDTVISNS